MTAMSNGMLDLASGGAMIVLEPRAGRAPAWRHWGAAVDLAGLPPLAQARGPASFSFDQDVPFDTAPVGGLGWFGPAALALRDATGAALDVSWTDCDWARTGDGVMIRLEDGLRGLRLVQTILADGQGGFRIGATLTNNGPAAVSLDWLASAALPLPADAARLVSWRGRHNAELVEQNEPMPAHAWVREGRRGLAGHGGPPGVFVLGEGAGHAQGRVHALQLCWSGDSLIRVERDDEGFFTLMAGAHLQPGEVTLSPGELGRARSDRGLFQHGAQRRDARVPRRRARHGALAGWGHAHPQGASQFLGSLLLRSRRSAHPGPGRGGSTDRYRALRARRWLVRGPQRRHRRVGGLDARSRQVSAWPGAAGPQDHRHGHGIRPVGRTGNDQPGQRSLSRASRLGTGHAGP
jgi:hypothetical protein